MQSTNPTHSTDAGHPSTVEAKSLGCSVPRKALALEEHLSLYSTVGPSLGAACATESSEGALPVALHLLFPNCSSFSCQIEVANKVVASVSNLLAPGHCSLSLLNGDRSLAGRCLATSAMCVSKSNNVGSERLSDVEDALELPGLAPSRVVVAAPLLYGVELSLLGQDLLHVAKLGGLPALLGAYQRLGAQLPCMGSLTVCFDDDIGSEEWDRCIINLLLLARAASAHILRGGLRMIGDMAVVLGKLNLGQPFQYIPGLGVRPCVADEGGELAALGQELGQEQQQAECAALSNNESEIGGGSSSSSNRPNCSKQASCREWTHADDGSDDESGAAPLALPSDATTEENYPEAPCKAKAEGQQHDSARDGAPSGCSPSKTTGSGGSSPSAGLTPAKEDTCGGGESLVSSGAEFLGQTLPSLAAEVAAGGLSQDGLLRFKSHLLEQVYAAVLLTELWHWQPVLNVLAQVLMVLRLAFAFPFQWAEREPQRLALHAIPMLFSMLQELAFYYDMPQLGPGWDQEHYVMIFFMVYRCYHAPALFKYGLTRALAEGVTLAKLGMVSLGIVNPVMLVALCKKMRFFKWALILPIHAAVWLSLVPMALNLLVGPGQPLYYAAAMYAVVLVTTTLLPGWMLYRSEASSRAAFKRRMLAVLAGQAEGEEEGATVAA